MIMMMMGNFRVKLTSVGYLTIGLVLNYATFMISSVVSFQEISNGQTLLSVSSVPTGSRMNTASENKFIMRLIGQEKFVECSLFLIQDGFDNGESIGFLSYEASNQLKSSYVVKMSNNTTNRFPLSDSNNRRKSSQCLVPVILIKFLNPKLLRKIDNMIAPVYIPITRKDEDFYIFKINAKLHFALLNMEELPNKIKFKIAVGYESQTQKVVVSTICFFCNSGGKPRLLHFPVGEESLALEEINYFPDFVWNLNGETLEVSTCITTLIEADPPWEGVNNAKRGIWKNLLEEFLTVIIYFNCGVQLENGTWTGTTGDLIAGRADLGIAIASTSKRAHYIDFTNSIFTVGCLTFVTGKPVEIYSPAALLCPFDVGMWSSIICSTGLSLLFCSLAFQTLRKFRQVLRKSFSWRFNTQIHFFFATLLEQEAPLVPKYLSLRIFASVWLLFAMVVTNAYRSKLVTLLAFPTMGTLPRTFEQLAFSHYRIGFLKIGDSAYNTLAASTDTVYVKLLSEMEIFEGVALECVEKVVKEDNYGCIGYNFALTHLRERNLSSAESRRLKFSTATTYNIWMGLATRPKSIYRVNFGKMLSYTRPFHLPDIWEKWDFYYNVHLPKLDWWRETNQTIDKMKNDEKVEGSDNLTLKHITGSFFVLILCMVLSTAIFIYENIIYNVHSIPLKYLGKH